MKPSVVESATERGETSENYPRLAVLGGCDSIDRFAARSEVLDVQGNNDMTQLVMETDLKWLRFHVIPSYFEQHLRFNMENRHLLCNIVSEPDQNPRVLKTIARIVKQSGLPVLNRPEQVMKTTRDGVAKLLEGIPGLLVPKTVRLPASCPRALREAMEQSGLRFPALIREAGRHNGEFLGLFQTPEEADPLLDQTEGVLLVTEFVDFVWPDGLYRKDRVMFIGDKIIPRHRVISNVWNLHGRDKQTIMYKDQTLIGEERQMVTSGFEGLAPVTQKALHGVQERMGLDYFGMDCNTQPDGTVILFEANATTNFFPLGRNPGSAYLRPLLLPVGVAAMQRLVEKLAIPPRVG